MATLDDSRSPEEPASRRSQRYLAVFAVSALACALFGLWISTDAARRDALIRLPEPERRALYERTLDALESSCGAAKVPNALENFCREQAAFVRAFPECDAACQALSQGHLAAPSR